MFDSEGDGINIRDCWMSDDDSDEVTGGDDSNWWLCEKGVDNDGAAGGRFRTYNEDFFKIKGIVQENISA